jgi:hypothetical protein
MGSDGAALLRDGTRCAPAEISQTATCSGEKVVGFFLGWIPSRKNPKKCIYLSGKTGRLNWRLSASVLAYFVGSVLKVEMRT